MWFIVSTLMVFVDPIIGKIVTLFTGFSREILEQAAELPDYTD